jgi:DNA-directed RNA polymerase specialized sigma24 family protein
MSSPRTKPQAEERKNRPGTPRDEAGELFAAWSARLRRAVASRVKTSEANLDDACAFAWAQLLRHHPRREIAFGWLMTVATREAWHLHGQERAAIHHDDLADHCLVDTTSTYDDRMELRDVLRHLEAIHPRRREMLLLHVSGYTFDEIGRFHGITPARARALVYKARLQLREIAADDGPR